MSHFTEIRTCVKDLAALTLAIRDLGLDLSLVKGVGGKPTIRGYATATREVDIAVRLHGPYDAGFLQQPDGTYQLVADWWGGHVAQEIGDQGGKLLQRYAYHVIRLQAWRKGWSVHQTMNADGSLRLVLTGRRLG